MTEALTCTGVRTHNLKNFNLNIPLKKWIAVTGVSGSGKSSLVFDTIYAEAQRRFLETLGTYERQFLQGLPQGEFDEIDNIPAAVALKQSNKTGDPRSVIATASDLAEPMRNLFVALMDWACVKCGSAVSVNRSEELIDFLCDEKRKLDRESYLISVPFEFEKIQKENVKRVLEDLAIEGYTKLLWDEQIVSLDGADFSQMDSSHRVELVCDRINCSTDNEEIQNRVETIWSQIRFSSRVSFLNVRKIDGKSIVFTDKQKFHVQPFCNKCNSQTTVIQSSDLDWQSILGACKRCHGLGNIPVLDEKKIIPNPALSLSQGAIKPWTSETFDWMQDELLHQCKKRNIKVTDPYQNLSSEVKNWIWTGEEADGKNRRKSEKFVTIKEFFDVLEAERYKSTSRILLAKYRKYVTCPDCHGARVGEPGRNATCFGKTYHELFKCEVQETFQWVESLKQEKKFEKKIQAISEIYNEVCGKFSLLIKLGLGTTQLFRRCKTLSGGEYQRVLLTRVIGNGLTDALYVLDEPSVGLGKKEIVDLISCIEQLRDLGNTVLMVEHDKLLIQAADDVIELGPGGGEEGGHLLLVENKIPISFQNQFTLSGGTRSQVTKSHIFKPEESLYLENFSCLNCKDINLEIGFGKLNVIGGPSGSGKSTLAICGLQAALEMFEDTGETSNSDMDLDSRVGIWKKLSLPQNFMSQTDVISVEQKAMHRTITSVPATVLGLMDLLRKNFAATRAAKELDLTASDFSFNGAGGCETCGGKGHVEDDLFFLGHVEKTCPDCNGSRYRQEILSVNWHGKNIAQWLSTSLGETAALLKGQSGFEKPLSLASSLGLKHLQLGLATSNMSGGEAQRLRICAALSKSSKKIFCILDEPTRGLSETDIGHLLETLLRLCRQGHTFVVVEHHELFEQYADHFIRLGPASGIAGGKIMERSILSR